jgi:hypothetical protein
MWAVEAKNYGENKDYFYMSGLTQRKAQRLQATLSNSGEWAMTRSWDKEHEWEQERAAERIRKFGGTLSV